VRRTAAPALPRKVTRDNDVMGLPAPLHNFATCNRQAPRPRASGAPTARLKRTIQKGRRRPLDHSLAGLGTGSSRRPLLRAPQDSPTLQPPRWDRIQHAAISRPSGEAEARLAALGF